MYGFKNRMVIAKIVPEPLPDRPPGRHKDRSPRRHTNSLIVKRRTGEDPEPNHATRVDNRESNLMFG